MVIQTNGTAYIVVAVSILFLSLIYLASNFLRKKLKRVRVSEIYYYPIKSCKGIRVDEAVVVRTGFKYDRLFMLVDSKMKFISQRTFPKMALIEVQITEQKGMVTNASGFRALMHLLQTPK